MSDRSARGAARFRSATPVLRCADYPRAREHYTRVLGFKVTEEGGEPPRFGILERERAVLYLDSWHGGPAPDRSGWDVYFHIDDLDSLFDAYREAGAEIVRTIETTVYGMREFEVLDPDGNRLCFGEDAEPEEKQA